MPGNVLIVDDSATMRQMVRRAMNLAGLDVNEVYEASNGIEALAHLAEHTVGVIVADINMPTMNGMQLLRRLKENPKLSAIPVLIASTEGSRARIDQLTEIGAFGFVRKPFHPERLRDLLKPLLGVRENAEHSDPDTGIDVF
jgi:two-component system chemotaxis response regulator CheY